MAGSGATAAVALLSLAGACGGSAGSTGAEPGASTGAALPAAELALVAYSTPQDAYDAITEAFRRTPGPQHHLHQVLRGVG